MDLDKKQKTHNNDATNKTHDNANKGFGCELAF